MALPENIPQCQHIRVNGVRCGSPALVGRDFCYFHQRAQKQFPPRATKPNIKSFPLLEDANSVQCALMQTIDAILSDKIDPRKAGLLLYALQTASTNLKRAHFDPFWRDVVT